MKYLIINADDFGYSEIFNKSILNLIEKKLITSTTVMVNHITKNQNKQIKKLIEINKFENISIGLHLEFDKDSNFEEEIEKQFKQFKDIFRFEPSHIDIHKVFNATEPTAQKALEFCEKNELPLRNYNFKTDYSKLTSQKYTNGTEMDLKQLEKWIKSLKDSEVYEILFHPGTFDPNCKSSLNKQREEDITKIEFINSKIKDKNIKLVSYNNF